jgi:hypothetical protein
VPYHISHPHTIILIQNRSFRYDDRTSLSGILQFYSVASKRMKGTSTKNLEMFEHLCGKAALRNVMLVTTNWDRASDSLASSREAELQSNYWMPLIKQGSRVVRFYPRTFDAAWGILSRFSATPYRALQLQLEMVDERKELREVSTTKFPVHRWKKFVEGLNGVVQKSESMVSFGSSERAIKDKKMLNENQSEQATRSRFPLRRGSNSAQHGSET